MISPATLAILCCPETHQPVELAPRALVDEINGRIAAGQLQNMAGKTIADPLEAALIRQDRRVLYPVRGSIPVMLVDEAIPLD
jgi:uncharacterized protein YbaR (Trm112 family)